MWYLKPESKVIILWELASPEDVTQPEDLTGDSETPYLQHRALGE